MTTAISISQLTVTPQHETIMRWNCDEYHIVYNRRTKVLTVEEIDDPEVDGILVTDPAEVDRILDEHKPGWIGLDGFVELKAYYGNRWTIGA